MPEQPEHQTPERRTLEGKHIATFEDLEGLDPQQLIEVALECDTEEFDPESCVSCRAYTIREGQREQEPQVIPEILDLAQRVTEEDKPVAERFAQQVRALESLVQELLEGPPIPPPDVTLEELAALVIGADKWVSMIRMQGLELAPAQQSILEEVERVVAKVRHVRA